MTRYGKAFKERAVARLLPWYPGAGMMRDWLKAGRISGSSGQAS